MPRVKQEPRVKREPVKLRVLYGDSLATRMALYEARRAIQQVHLQRFIDRMVSMKLEKARSIACRIARSKVRSKLFRIDRSRRVLPSRAMLPFYGGATVTRIVD